MWTFGHADTQTFGYVDMWRSGYVDFFNCLLYDILTLLSSIQSVGLLCRYEDMVTWCKVDILKYGNIDMWICRHEDICIYLHMDMWTYREVDMWIFKNGFIYYILILLSSIC